MVRRLAGKVAAAFASARSVGIGADMRDVWGLPLLHIGGGGCTMIALGERAMGSQVSAQ